MLRYISRNPLFGLVLPKTPKAQGLLSDVVVIDPSQVVSAETWSARLL